MRKTKVKRGEKLKNQKAITLIALVITIIVLLILAAVSIATLTGENGILTEAGNSKTQTEIGEEKEAIGLAYNGAKTEKLGGEITAEDLNTQFTKNGVNATASGTGTITVEFPDTGRSYKIDNNGNVTEMIAVGGTATSTVKDNYTDGTNSATIPAGFTVSATENTISTGLVVTAPDGSEFVWVPASVDSMATRTSGQDENHRDNYQGKLYEFSGTGDSTSSTEKTTWVPGKTNYREPSLVTGNSADTYAVMETITGTNYDAKSDYYNTILGYAISTGAKDFGKDMQKDYNAMIESVNKYGGFYIGRYETSIAGETVASTKGTTDTRPMASINWYEMYKKQKNYANSIESVSSSMIWGSQWDSMLNWALTGSDKGNVTATDKAPHNLSSTDQPGTQDNDKINNIYDLEGNVREWTLEAFSPNSRVYRGRFLQ